MSPRRFRFSWHAFPAETCAALAAALGAPPGSDAPTYLTSTLPRPDAAFVRRYRAVICEHWLARYPGTPALVGELSRGRVVPSTPEEGARWLAERRATGKLCRQIAAAMIRYGDMERRAPTDGEVQSFMIVEPATCPPDTRTPHDYQREAWQKLTEHAAHAADAGQPLRGILSLPTGGGKTFTAGSWLARGALSRGRRVLWIAHREELLVQGAREFRRCAGTVDGVDKLRIRIVSGRHCSPSMIDPADHVVIASIQSLARSPQALRALASDPRLMVVIDEAHHAAARSYRELIDLCAKHGGGDVIGLTATPTRTVPAERRTLSRLFGDCILYQVGMRRLVERGTLARPLLARVSTGQDVTDGLTDADREHLGRFRDLSDGMAARIAQMTERNRVIVDHYLEHRDEYGPTLIFALSIEHAALLTEELRERGVRADYVVHRRPDGDLRENADVIAKMKSGDLEVLVNVQILTEGVDIPCVHTVLLARPTQSETLFRQMIGRALRGPAAGGTATAHLVTFDDHWASFPDWEHPFSLVPDVVAVAQSAESAPDDANDSTPAPSASHTLDEHLPWEQIRAAAAVLRRSAPLSRCEVFRAIPAGYYLLEFGDAQPAHPVLVQAHHEPGWRSLWDALYAPDADPTDGPELVYGRAFHECEQPQPSPHDVHRALAYVRAGGARPSYVSLAERVLSDPERLAQEIRDRDLGEGARVELIRERHGDLARVAYPALADYAAAVAEALHRMRFGANAA